MKLERSNVDFPIWRKKVDSSLFAYRGTTNPTWACNMWNIQSFLGYMNSKTTERYTRISKTSFSNFKNPIEGLIGVTDNNFNNEKPD